MTIELKERLKKFTGKIITVTGPIDPEQMGCALPHEHIMSTFGAESARYPYYDLEQVLAAVLPYLERIRGFGCQTIVDCTAAYFGRHPELLRRIAMKSGLAILTNTGYYGAAEDRYVPVHAFAESVAQISARWVREFVFSIDDTGIYPGFIKTAVDEGPLSEIDRKLIFAAGHTHLQTGLTIQTHTGANVTAAQDIIKILQGLGVHPGAWIWTHAHQAPSTAPLIAAAQAGAWLSLDGINAENCDHILQLAVELKQNGYLANLLLSHDGDSYFGEGEFRPYHYLFTDFIPLLIKNGFNKDEIWQMMVDNPRRAFTIQIRQ
jgi:predicted metal-dependent phosphotriesterase family hydrolase